MRSQRVILYVAINTVLYALLFLILIKVGKQAVEYLTGRTLAESGLTTSLYAVAISAVIVCIFVQMFVGIGSGNKR